MTIPTGERPRPCTGTAIDGDFARLYRSQYGAVFAFAYRRVGNPTQAEDVAAQAFLHALQAYDRYEDRGVPVTAWLLRIAANIIREQARRERREMEVMRAAARPLEWDGSLSDRPCDWAERAERRAWIAGHLAALSRDQRRVVARHYGADRPIDEVAREMGRSPGATKQLLHRSIKVLRARVVADDAVCSGGVGAPHGW